MQFSGSKLGDCGCSQVNYYYPLFHITQNTGTKAGEWPEKHEQQNLDTVGGRDSVRYNCFGVQIAEYIILFGGKCI